MAEPEVKADYQVSNKYQDDNYQIFVLQTINTKCF
jgi:hypothetical protein